MNRYLEFRAPSNLNTVKNFAPVFFLLDAPAKLLPLFFEYFPVIGADALGVLPIRHIDI